MRVAELMTIDPIKVHGETSLIDVARLMDKHHVNGLPVIDSKNTLIGIVTQGDLLRRPELGTDRQHASWLAEFFLRSRVEDDFVHTHGRYVSEVMTPRPTFVSPDSMLSEVAELMTRKRFRCLPVVHNSVLVGMISRSDLVRSLAAKLPAKTESSDDDIKLNILGCLAQEKWAPRTGIRIEVEAGTVGLEGIIFNDNDRRAVKVIAENAPGVKHVNDHLVYVDAGSGMTFPETM